MQGVRDSRKESCALQRAAKVKNGKSVGKNEKKYKNTTNPGPWEDEQFRWTCEDQWPITGQDFI